MPYAKTDDRVKIYYEEHGSGFPLVLAYGIGGNTTMWEPNIPGLGARYRLILWDPRGHGRSDSPEDPARYSFRRWALDLRDLLDHLGIRKAYVGGLSMGGGIATRFTLLYPKRVAALIITNSSSASGLPLPVENLVMRAKSIEITLTKGTDAMAEFAMAANPNVTARLQLDPNAKEEFYAMYRALTPIGYANALRALIAMDHITDELPKIKAPTLLIGGDQDPSLGPMKVIKKKIRGSRLVVLSPASHFANRDQPEAWNRAVLEFLARVDVRAEGLRTSRRGGQPRGEARLDRRGR